MFGRKASRDGERQPQPDSHVLLGLAIALISLAGTALGLSFPLKDQAAVVALRITAAGLGLCGAGLLVAWLFQRSRRAKEWFEDFRAYDVTPLPVGGANLKNVVEAGRKAIGDAHPDEKTLSQRLEENAKVLSVWGRNRSNGRSRFCGYLLLYPLTDETAEGIMNGSIRSEREFGERPLAPTFEEARYIYVGMVLGVDVHAKSQVVILLRAELYQLLAKNQVQKVFARKGSPGGWKLMQQYNFRPLLGEQEDGIWFVGSQTLKAQLYREQAHLIEPYAGSQRPAAGDEEAEAGPREAKIRRSSWVERLAQIFGRSRERGRDSTPSQE